MFCSIQTPLNSRAAANIRLLFWAVGIDDRSDKYCKNFECPKDYYLVDDADTTVCKDHECTKDVCCEKDCEFPIGYCLACRKIVLRCPFPSTSSQGCLLTSYQG